MQLPMLIVFQHIDKEYNIYKNFITIFRCRIWALIVSLMNSWPKLHAFFAPYTKLLIMLSENTHKAFMKNKNAPLTIK